MNKKDLEFYSAILACSRMDMDRWLDSLKTLYPTTFPQSGCKNLQSNLVKDSEDYWAAKFQIKQ